MLAAITLVGGGAGNGGARARVSCDRELLLCSLAITALLGVGSGPKLLEQKPWGSGPNLLSSLQKWALPSSSTGTPVPERSSTRARGAGVGIPWGLGHGLWWSGPHQKSKLPPMCRLCKGQQWLPLPCSDTALGLRPLSISWPSSFFICGSPCSSVELWHEASRAGAFTWGTFRKPVSHPCFLNPHSLCCFRSKHLCASYEKSPGFLALMSVPLAFQPFKGAHLLDPRACAPSM